MKDYVRELRSRVGHWPVIMVGAGVIILDDAGRVLLMRRTDNGAWSIPGGARDCAPALLNGPRRTTCNVIIVHFREVLLSAFFLYVLAVAAVTLFPLWIGSGPDVRGSINLVPVVQTVRMFRLRSTFALKNVAGFSRLLGTCLTGLAVSRGD